MERSGLAMITILVTVSSFGTPLGAAPPDQFLITPGGSIGLLRLGMSISDAATTVGTPKSTLPATSDDPATVLPATTSRNIGLTSYTWFDYAALENQRGQYAPNTSGANGGLLAYATQTGKIVMVAVVYAPQYMLGNGLHTGSTEREVRDAMGAPTTQVQGPGFHSLVYRAQGIVFRIVDAPGAVGYRAVYSIVIFTPQ